MRPETRIAEARRWPNVLGDDRVNRAAGPQDVAVVGIAANQQENGTVLFLPLETVRAMLGEPGGASTYWIETDSSEHAFVDRTTTAIEDEPERRSGWPLVAAAIGLVAATALITCIRTCGIVICWRTARMSMHWTRPVNLPFLTRCRLKIATFSNCSLRTART